MKKIIKILAIIAAVIVLFFASFLIYNYIRIQRGDLIKWDNHWYTKKQLAEKFPPQYTEVPAKNTPEEVYAKFRQALLDNDFETALNQIVEKNRDQYREASKDTEKLKMWIEKLPDTITKENEMGNFSYYNMEMGTDYKNTVSFIKDNDGYWLIDQI